jgi:hypothetical protein
MLELRFNDTGRLKQPQSMEKAGGLNERKNQIAAP